MSLPRFHCAPVPLHGVHGTRGKLGNTRIHGAMSQILDKSILQWQLLRNVIPLFSLDLGNSWKLLQSEAADHAIANAQFKTHITHFRTHMRSLSKRRPKGMLTQSEFNLCKDDLSALLDFLESQIVLEKPHSARLPLETTSDDAPTEQWVLGSTQEYAHTTWRPPQLVKTYKNLKALGELIKQHKSEQGDDLFHIYQDSIKWGQKLENFEAIANLTKYIRKTFESIRPPAQGPPAHGDGEPGESMCNWNYHQPLELSSRLYGLLGKRTCQQGHQVKLQLDGFRLNRLETAGLRRFFVFLSCPRAPDEWREGKYKSIQMWAAP